MTLRYGLIGSGMMGGEHIRNINLLPDAKVTALADPDAGMLAASSAMVDGEKPKTFADHRELLSADLCDVYVVAAPNDLHHGIMVDLLATSKPILCEKPLCTTSDDCRDLIRRADGRDAPVWVAMEYRYMPPVHRLLTALDDGMVGVPVMMSIREHRFPFLEKVGDWNRFNRRTGGTLVEKCCHFWDLMRLALNSNPVRVFASAGVDVNHLDERYDGERPDIIDNAYVVVDFENGARGMLDLCMFAEGSYWQEVVSVTGPLARVDACVPGPARFSTDGEERHSQLVISDRATKQVTTEVLEVDESILAAGDHHGSSYFQHLAFYELATTGEGQPAVTLEDGLWSVLIGEAAELSARERTVIEL